MNIQNIDKHIGRSVMNYKNWQVWQWGADKDGNHWLAAKKSEVYFVCEWTKKVVHEQTNDDEIQQSISFDDWQRIRNNPHFDECYYYSVEALIEFAS